MRGQPLLGEYEADPFSGYGVAIRHETDPPIPGEPFMSMANAQRVLAEQKVLVIEDCAKIVDPWLKNSFYDMRKELAAAIRSLAAQPRETITRDQIVPHDVIGIKMTDDGMMFQTRNGSLRKPTDEERNGMRPQPRSNSVEDGVEKILAEQKAPAFSPSSDPYSERNSPQKAVIDTEQSGHVPSPPLKGS